MIEKLFRHVNVVIIAVGFYILFVLLFSKTISDYDIWDYLSFGRVFGGNDYFPYHDIFSYTPTKPLWVYHEWLTGIIFYPVLKYLGPAGLQLFRYIVIVLTIYLMYLRALKKNARPIFTSICISLALMLISYGHSPVMRAQIFTYLFSLY